MTLHLAGARRREGVDRGWAIRGCRLLAWTGPGGVISDHITVVSGDPGEENPRPRAAQRLSRHVQTGRKYNTVYLSTFFKDLNG